jgi:hypothetical protein
MSKFASARCITWSQDRIGVQFNRIGNYHQFQEILDDFKKIFSERYWDQEGWWIVPSRQYVSLRQFCTKHNMQLLLVERNETLLQHKLFS